jgi:hypothetical protein
MSSGYYRHDAVQHSHRERSRYCPRPSPAPSSRPASTAPASRHTFVALVQPDRVHTFPPPLRCSCVCPKRRGERSRGTGLAAKGTNTNSERVGEERRLLVRLQRSTICYGQNSHFWKSAPFAPEAKGEGFDLIRCLATTLSVTTLTCGVFSLALSLPSLAHGMNERIYRWRR